MTQFFTILIASAFLFLILWWDVNADFKKWKVATPVKHGSEWRKRALMAMPSIILFTVAHPWERGYSWGTFWSLVISICVVGFTFWLLFDGWYNAKRRQYLINTGAAPIYYKQFTFFYVGSFNEAAHSDSWLDKMQYWIGPTFSKIIKVTGVLVSITVYIISFISKS